MGKVLEHYLKFGIEHEKVYRSVETHYVFDDGWNLPSEVIEQIDLRIKESYAQRLRKLTRLHDNHVGDWITIEIARKYETMARFYRVINGLQYTGKLREMGEELQQLYGVTEIEAINILNGFNLRDYYEKYYRIQYLILEDIDAQHMCDVEVQRFLFEQVV